MFDLLYQPNSMRKILFVTAFTIAGITAAHAQTEKGNFLLGGGLSFQASGGNSVFTANPNVGIFVANNIAVGAQFVLLTADGYAAWAFGPFAKGYFAGSDKGKFYGQGSINVGGADGADVQLGAGLGAGYAVFLNRSIALEFGVNYSKTGESAGIFGLGAGFQIHFRK